VIVLCGDYEKKEWCHLEWRAVLDLIKKRRDDDIMFFRADEADIPGVYSIDGYVPTDAFSAAEAATLKRNGYNPRDYYQRQPELKKALDMIGDGFFSPGNPDLFKPLLDALLNHGDQYLLLADYADYVACQEEVSRLYLDQDEWSRRAILNAAGMGKFSSDRTIAEYAREIWQVEPVEVPVNCKILHR
jgi:hypothetical protein